MKSRLRRDVEVASVSETSRLGNDEESDDDDEDADLGDEFIPMGVSAGASEAAPTRPIADADEQARRAELVKELLQEEGDGQLARYEVRGSEKSWGASVAGHGSELSSLHVRVSSSAVEEDATAGKYVKIIHYIGPRPRGIWSAHMHSS